MYLDLHVEWYVRNMVRNVNFILKYTVYNPPSVLFLYASE